MPPQAHPTHKIATELGVPYESKQHVYQCEARDHMLTLSGSELVAGASHLRPPEDPILTRVRSCPYIRPSASHKHLYTNSQTLLRDLLDVRHAQAIVRFPVSSDSAMQETNHYWNSWIRRSTYNGSWKEAVHRSALALKLLIYEPTGAVVASPTFSLPEFIGGTRNW